MFISLFSAFSDRDARYARWKDAVKRTLGWESIVDDGSVDPGNSTDLI